ncbi:MAG TPA: hypothetical protein VGQ59_08750 [Cyclobacteriaceae bacterium]|jgi:hypothetical protein|nr:hypothetical protein [Cyclobacteriaceae bacterium]
MRWIRNFIIILVLIWVVGGCLKQPENSIIPQIQFQGLAFKHEMPNAVDTLIITLKFTDGDGDLGINGDETAIYTSATDSTDINSPFYYIYDTAHINSTWYYTHYNNLKLPKGFHYVNYASYRKFHFLPFDTLPGTGTLSCKNWEYRSSPSDTLYIQVNPYNNNIFVDVYTKNANGSYTFFDPTKIYPFGNLCVTNFFNSRFPILSSDLGKKSSLDGTITYKIQSAGLYIFLGGKTIKVKTYILDRAFHKSAWIESDDFIIK